MSDSRVPPAVSLLNHILAASLHGVRFAIIENELGDVGVDELIAGKKQSTNEDVIEVMNGCILLYGPL